MLPLHARRPAPPRQQRRRFSPGHCFRSGTAVMILAGGAMLLNLLGFVLQYRAEHQREEGSVPADATGASDTKTWAHPGSSSGGLPSSDAVRHPDQGCLDRPLVGTVIAHGTQPDCRDEPALKAETLNRIPKIIHQTYKTLDLPPDLRELVDSWVRTNPGWEVRHYSDADCNAMVASEFPQYLQAYRNLPKPVERADFFRYLVVLRYGGVYADMDTRCASPLDTYISDSDTLVAGWENEFPSMPKAVKRSYSRQTQLLQWVFAGAPGHPALTAVCDHIQQHYNTVFSTNTNTDTLDRTGPGAFTDALIGYMMSATGGPSAPMDQQWPVRLLPRVAFGAFGIDGLPVDSPGLLVQHVFKGSWKRGNRCHRWPKLFFFPRILAQWAMNGSSFHSFKKPPIYAPHLMRPQGRETPHPRWYIPHISGAGWSIDFWKWSTRAQHDACLIRVAEEPELELADLAESANISPHPVSVSWWPPFTMLVHQVGVEAMARQDGDDVSAHISAWGLWEAGWDPPMYAGPSSMHALLSVLFSTEPPEARRTQLGRATAMLGGVHDISSAQSGMLVDVFAGPGLFTLAASARGLKALALEPEAAFRQLLEGSVAINSWEDRVTVIPDVAGAEEGSDVCVRHGLGLPASVASNVSAPFFVNDDRRWFRNTTVQPVESPPGPHGCLPGQQLGRQQRLDTLVRKFLDEDPDDDTPTAMPQLVLRVADNAESVIAGATSLLLGDLLPGLLPPAVVLLELPSYKLGAAASLVKQLEDRYGYTGGTFHSGALCRGRVLVDSTPSPRWCQCDAGTFLSMVNAGCGAKSDGSRSISVVAMHKELHGTDAADQWLKLMTEGSAVGSCIL